MTFMSHTWAAKNKIRLNWLIEDEGQEQDKSVQALGYPLTFNPTNAMTKNTIIYNKPKRTYSFYIYNYNQNKIGKITSQIMNKHKTNK